MKTRGREARGTQLSMTGVHRPADARSYKSCYGAAPGQHVLYLGKVRGGPRYGSVGKVKEALARKAVVDLGGAGVWHIPYYFLGLPRAA